MSRLTEMETATRVVVNKINGGADLTGHPADMGIIQESELAFHGAGGGAYRCWSPPCEDQQIKKKVMGIPYSLNLQNFRPCL
ncbi:MAG: hypothetical protein DDT30_02189 [Dehalococcoidia bacterium]|nr:hypothetical protein [Bacillota bacterium]